MDFLSGGEEKKDLTKKQMVLAQKLQHYGTINYEVF